MATDSTSGSRASERPSSSTSELFGGIYARGAVADAVSDEAWLQAMLDVEAALGGPSLRAEEIDVAELGRAAAEHASPVVPRTPYLAVHLFARGLLRHLTTRICFDESAVPESVPADRRETLLPERTDDGYRFDIRLQGERETVFFDV